MHMATKTKNETLSDTLNTITQQAGIVLMTAAVTLGMIEVPEHAGRIVVPNQPAYASAGQHDAGGFGGFGGAGSDNSLRRESEETHPHHITYSVAQRTPGRTRGI